MLKSFIFNIFILDLSRTIYNLIIFYSPPNTLARDCLANDTFLLPIKGGKDLYFPAVVGCAY